MRGSCRWYGISLIESRALQKVFCSTIKGYFQQPKGRTVTWIVPHNFGHQNPATVDMKLMSVFRVLHNHARIRQFRLYNFEPDVPAVSGHGLANGREGEATVTEALNQSSRTVLRKRLRLTSSPSRTTIRPLTSARKVRGRGVADKALCWYSKFPKKRSREALVSVPQRGRGELVLLTACSTYTEEDDRITQISDREVISNKQLGQFTSSRSGFDSINQRKKLNEKDYAGRDAASPPGSPFIVSDELETTFRQREGFREAEEKGEQKKEERRHRKRKRRKEEKKQKRKTTKREEESRGGT